MFAVVLAVVLPVVITVAVGFLWTRYGYPLNSKELTALIADVATPCLIIATFQKSQLSFEAFAAMAGATAAAIVLFAGVGALALRAAGLRIRTFLPSIAFPNAGNLGLPLSLYAFGTEGLGYAIAFFSISSVANYTLGQMIAAGKANWRGLLRLPILYAVAIGIALSFWRIELPGWAGTTIALIGNVTVPLMLLMLGSSLSRLKVASVGRALLRLRPAHRARRCDRHWRRGSLRADRQLAGGAHPAMREPGRGLQLSLRATLEQRARGSRRRRRALDAALASDDPAGSRLAHEPGLKGANGAAPLRKPARFL